MDMECTNGPITENTKDNTWEIANMDLASIIGQMGESTKDSGWEANSMIWVSTEFLRRMK
jgi:hypothetical protein